MELERKSYVNQHGDVFWLTEEEAKERNITALKALILMFVVFVISLIMGTVPSIMDGVMILVKVIGIIGLGACAMYFIYKLHYYINT